MVYKLAMGQFAEIPHPTPRTLNDNSNPPPLEDIPSAPTRQDTPAPMKDQPQRICSKQGRTGQFPQTPVPTPTPTI